MTHEVDNMHGFKDAVFGRLVVFWSDATDCLGRLDVTIIFVRIDVG